MSSSSSLLSLSRRFRLSGAHYVVLQENYNENIEHAKLINQWCSSVEVNAMLDALFQREQQLDSPRPIYCFFKSYQRGTIEGVCRMKTRVNKPSVRWPNGGKWNKNPTFGVEWVDERCKNVIHLNDFPSLAEVALKIDGNRIDSDLGQRLFLTVVHGTNAAVAAAAAAGTSQQQEARGKKMREFCSIVDVSTPLANVASAATTTTTTTTTTATTTTKNSVDTPPAQADTGESLAEAKVDAKDATLRRQKYPNHFLRPSYRQPDGPYDAIEFMIVDMHTTNTRTNLWEVEEEYEGETNVYRNYFSFFVRLFGVTAKGNSVCCYLSEWKPFLYLEIPPAWSEIALDAFIGHVDEMSGIKFFRRNVTSCKIVHRKNIYGYTKGTPIKVAKLCFRNASSKRALSRWLHENPTAYNYLGLQYRFHLWDAKIEGKGVDDRQQFVNCTDIKPSHWVRLPANKYTFNQPATRPAPERRARTQIDVNVCYTDVEPLNERNDVPPLLIESWDLEVVRAARDRRFPSSSEPGDEIIQVGTSVWCYGDKDDDGPAYAAVHCVRPTENWSPDKMDVNEYATEREMLPAYLEFSRDKVDADVRIGFNTYGFDNKYLEDRLMMKCRHLFPDKVSRYDYGKFEFGRVRGVTSKCRSQYGGSKAHGKRETYTMPAAGRVQLDLYKWSSEEWKMPRGLDFIAEKKLGMHKKDLKFWQINERYFQTAHDRGEIADYCVTGDTPIATRTGLSIRICDLFGSSQPMGRATVDGVTTFSVSSDCGDRFLRDDATVEFAIKQPVLRKVIRITMFDGRTLTITPDHPVLVVKAGAVTHDDTNGDSRLPSSPVWSREFLASNAGWSPAGDVGPGDHVISTHLATVLDDATPDAGRDFVLARWNYGRERDKTLAFARLCGAAMYDGTTSAKKRQTCIYVADRFDADVVYDDVDLLMGAGRLCNRSARYCDNGLGGTYSVYVPVELSTDLIAAGVGGGRKSTQAIRWPDFVTDPNCPASVRREFVATLWGGDGGGVQIDVRRKSVSMSPLRMHVRVENGDFTNVEVSWASFTTLTQILESDFTIRSDVSVRLMWQDDNHLNRPLTSDLRLLPNARDLITYVLHQQQQQQQRDDETTWLSYAEVIAKVSTLAVDCGYRLESATDEPIVSSRDIGVDAVPFQTPMLRASVITRVLSSLSSEGVVDIQRDVAGGGVASVRLDASARNVVPTWTPDARQDRVRLVYACFTLSIRSCDISRFADRIGVRYCCEKSSMLAFAQMHSGWECRLARACVDYVDKVDADITRGRSVEQARLNARESVLRAHSLLRSEADVLHTISARTLRKYRSETRPDPRDEPALLAWFRQRRSGLGFDTAPSRLASMIRFDLATSSRTRSRLVLAPVVRVDALDEPRIVFDLSVPTRASKSTSVAHLDDEPNFLANGFVVHNCRVDTELPLLILNKEQILLQCIIFSRLTGLTIDDIINKKQMVRTFAKLSKYAHERGYMFPDDVKRFVIDDHLYSMLFGCGTYEGATVIDPMRGFYDTPISTLDFAGLYPSIMRGYKLCYTTLILDKRWLDDPETEYVTIEIPNIDPKEPPFVLHWCTNWQPLLYDILTDILDKRSWAKKERNKHAKGSFLYALYDAWQLGLKLIANSLYGYTGADEEINHMSNKAIAASVTWHGRRMIGETKAFVEREVPGSTVIYGDSVTADTPIIVTHEDSVGTRHKDACVVPIADAFANEFDGHMGFDWFVDPDGKEWAEPREPTYVWSDAGFTRVIRVIRHRAPGKRLYRVSTPAGSVDVTEDHSLLRADATPTTAREVTMGTQLLHAQTLPAVLAPAGGITNAAHAAAFAFVRHFHGVEAKRGRTAACTGVEVVELEPQEPRWFVRIVPERVAETTSSPLAPKRKRFTKEEEDEEEENGDAPSERTRDTLAPAQQCRVAVPASLQRRTLVDVECVTSLRLLREASCTEYVYDLQTESHHFAAGIGRLVVHNTDSVMIRFPRDWDRAKVFEVSKRLAAQVTALFPPEVELEFEKVFDPYLLLGKKQYGGYKYESLEESPKFARKGVSSVRGDRIKFVKRLTDDTIRAMCDDRSPERALRMLEDNLQRLVDEDIDPSEFVIEKKLTRNPKEYGNVAHAKVAREMAERDPGTAPKSGDLVAYVHAQNKKTGESKPVNYAYFTANRDIYRIHTVHYVEKLIVEALGKLLDVPGVCDDPYRVFDRFVAIAHAKGMRVNMSQFLTSADDDVYRGAGIGAKSAATSGATITSSSSSASTGTTSAEATSDEIVICGSGAPLSKTKMKRDKERRKRRRAEEAARRGVPKTAIGKGSLRGFLGTMSIDDITSDAKRQKTKRSPTKSGGVQKRTATQNRS